MGLSRLSVALEVHLTQDWPISSPLFLVITIGSGKGMRTRLGIFAGRTGQESACRLEGGKLRAAGGHISTRGGEHL